MTLLATTGGVVSGNDAAVVKVDGSFSPSVSTARESWAPPPIRYPSRMIAKGSVAALRRGPTGNLRGGVRAPDAAGPHFGLLEQPDADQQHAQGGEDEDQPARDREQRKHEPGVRKVAVDPA